MRDSQQSANAQGQWDSQTMNSGDRIKSVDYPRPNYAASRQIPDPRVLTTPTPNQHMRNGSGATGAGSSSDLDGSFHPLRRGEYDVQSVESSMTSPRSSSKNPVPAPTVTVRSEFPTLNRSRQQQSLTCLITVEVPDGKWRPDPEDMRTMPPIPSFPYPHHNHHALPEDSYGHQISPILSNKKFDQSYEPPEMVDEITEDLHARVDTWHGLDFSRYVPGYLTCIHSKISERTQFAKKISSRFGKLRLHGTVRVGKDRQQWQELECYLFTEMLICVKEKKISPPQQQWDSVDSLGNGQKKTKCTLKGSILIKKHLKQVESSSSMYTYSRK